jgi:ribosome-associated protein
MALAVADEHKGEELLLLDMRDVTLVADYFVLVTGANYIHVGMLADRLEERLKAAGIRMLHREGGRRSHWTLLDYGDVVVHIFTPDERRYYDLERLWGDARIIAGHQTG